MDHNQLRDVRAKVEAMEKELKKTMDSQINKLSSILKQTEVKKEKRGKILKKPCNLQLFGDGSVKIIFDNPNDSNALFE